MEFIIKSKKYGDKIVLIDEEDYDKIKDYKCCLSFHKRMNTFYIIIHMYKDSKHIDVLLHRFIMNCPKDKLVDHKNHDTLKNTKDNLRICTHAENQRNQKIRKGLSSKHKGVYFNKKENKYVAQIKYNNKQIGIGRFETEKEAGESYNKKALELYGEFALLNIII